MSEHVYLVVTGTENHAAALTKGRTDYAVPPYNRSERYSMDGQKLIMEGLFTDGEMAWFRAQPTVIILGDHDATVAYLEQSPADWQYPPSSE